ncbi:MAG: hypothetical protein J6M07_02140, partial [Ruminococcus sp.]|nr:hypothetical protein [Ruminococcus sp.]
SGKNLSEERFFPRTPFPKSFNRIFPLRGRSTKDVKTSSITVSALSGEKLIVLGNRFEKILLQKVYLNNSYKTSLSVPPLTLRGCFYVYSEFFQHLVEFSVHIE